jgi:hypothetical protein
MKSNACRQTSLAASVTKSQLNVILPKTGGARRKSKVSARGPLKGKRRDQVSKLKLDATQKRDEISVQLPSGEVPATQRLRFPTARKSKFEVLARVNTSSFGPSLFVPRPKWNTAATLPRSVTWISGMVERAPARFLPSGGTLKAHLAVGGPFSSPPGK